MLRESLLLALLAAPVGTGAAWSAETQEAAARAVREPIREDTVWEGRIAVEALIVVEGGATLTVRPGTEIRFAAAGGLSVGGVLRAEGTAEKPILFLPAAGGEEPWTGIVLANSPTASVLRFCRILRARTIEVAGGEHRIEECGISGGAVGLSVAGESSHPLIARNRIADCTEAGIRCFAKAAPVIADNVIERSGKAGISAVSGAVPDIRGNRLSGCESGIELSQVPPRISGNTVTGCVRGIALSGVTGGEPVRGNRLEGNEAGILCQQFSEPDIFGNSVVKNRDGIVCFHGARPRIRNNDLLENDMGLICNELSDPEVSANTIARNRRGIFLNHSSYPAIHGNNLTDNEVQIELLFMSMDFERRSPEKPRRGRQQQSLIQAQRGVAMPDGSKRDGFEVDNRVLDASGNWWGEATTREMEQKGPDANIAGIKDGHDPKPYDYEYLQDKVTYAPWAKERFAAAGVPPP